MKSVVMAVIEERLTPGEALPTEAHCLSHLALLELFVILKSRVQRAATERGMTPENGWTKYLDTSVGKFADWVSSRILVDTENSQLPVLPSLDVLMVWHAFMLNPIKYAKFETLMNFKLPRCGIDWNLMSQDINTVTSPAFDSATITERLANTKTESIPREEDFEFTLSPGRPARFPFNLKAAVERQFSFSTKMVQYAWHRSCNPNDTLRRAIDRYAKFFSLLALNRGTNLVPTLDVDVVWHTHQLNPEQYRIFSASVTGGRVVNHDDTIGAEVLGPAFADTGGLFKTVFGDNYGVCLCWMCESGRSGEALDRFEIERRIRDEESRRQEAGLNVDLKFAMPACNECGTRPAQANDGARGVLEDGSRGLNRGSGDCSAVCSTTCSSHCSGGNCSGCGSNCNGGCGSGCGGG